MQKKNALQGVLRQSLFSSAPQHGLHKQPYKQNPAECARAVQQHVGDGRAATGHEGLVDLVACRIECGGKQRAQDVHGRLCRKAERIQQKQRAERRVDAKMRALAQDMVGGCQYRRLLRFR